MPTAQSVRVVVKLPYNGPDNAPALDPPKIEWTPEKADILWKVIEIQRTRAVDSAGADWKGLAAHLEVPLPYLLYRVNARFQEEIRGLQDVLSPTSGQPSTDIHKPCEIKPSTSKLANGIPLDVRARLNSLSNSFTPRQKKVSISSSIMTLQGTRKVVATGQLSPSSSGDEENSSDEDAIKEEDTERIAEEEEALSRKLADLQKMMTNEKLGLVSGTIRHRGIKRRDHGRLAPLSSLSGGGSYRHDTLSSASASRSGSQSISSTSSPHGSIPDIPSPPSDKNGNFVGQTPRNVNARQISGRNSLRRLVDRTGDLSSQSEASSFSDLSDASISASALEDAFMSNIGSNNNSHLSHFARSRLSNRAHSSVPL